MELSLADLADFARKIVVELPEQKGKRAHIIGLKGELGAGKTTLVQMIAKELGIQNPVTSPTFVIVQAYPIAHPVFSRLIHIDAYRVTPKDAHTIGWDSYVADSTNLMLVEWPENIPEFPKDAAVITLEVTGENSRMISYYGD